MGLSQMSPDSPGHESPETRPLTLGIQLWLSQGFYRFPAPSLAVPVMRPRREWRARRHQSAIEPAKEEAVP